MIVLALDPGGTTGTCAINWDGRRSTLPVPEDLLCAKEVPFDEMPGWLDEMLSTLPISLIVIERFTISPRTIQYTRQPEALYVIGGAIFLGRIRGIPVRMQDPASAKKAYPNERLKDWKVKGPHAKDALRHALLSCHRRM